VDSKTIAKLERTKKNFSGSAAELKLSQPILPHGLRGVSGPHRCGRQIGEYKQRPSSAGTIYPSAQGVIQLARYVLPHGSFSFIISALFRFSVYFLASLFLLSPLSFLCLFYFYFSCPLFW
jgi:hypothetical protein